MLRPSSGPLSLQCQSCLVKGDARLSYLALTASCSVQSYSHMLSDLLGMDSDLELQSTRLSFAGIETQKL